MTTRRRVLSILAGVAALPLVGARASEGVRSWRGVVLGAEARIILNHPDADVLINGAVKEIHRLENIFSLHLPDSQLSRLNHEGVLNRPAFEMVELLSSCSVIHSRTGGAFDPSVQALWSLYARSHAAGLPPTVEQINETLTITGWGHVSYSPEKVSFDRSGVSLTMNGIAQGFIADKVTQYFRRNGVTNVLVNTGEIAALGLAPGGEAWQVNFNNVPDSVPLTDAAIATSAMLGTAFDKEGAVGHIIDPRTGYPGGNWSEVTVISSSATEADGLSTAFSLMGQNEIEAAQGTAKVFLG